jgi:hypothetical protein
VPWVCSACCQAHRLHSSDTNHSTEENEKGVDSASTTSDGSEEVVESELGEGETGHGGPTVTFRCPELAQSFTVRISVMCCWPCRQS